MKMTNLEKWFVSSAFRVYLQRRFEAPRVLSGLNLGKESICLEIGCGHGAGMLLINQYLGGERVIGVDIDLDQVNAARKYLAHPPGWAKNIRTDNIDLICEDATGLSFPDSCFDAAFLFGVLDHITEWREVVAEVFRVLKVNGIFSFEEFLLGKRGNRWGHVVIGEAELKSTLGKIGFSIQSFQTTRLIPRCFTRAIKAGGQT